MIDSYRVFDRFDQFMKVYKLTENSISEECGVSNGLIGKARKNKRLLSSDIILKIVEKYPELNIDWLYTGRGEMLIDNQNVSIGRVNGNGNAINNGNGNLIMMNQADEIKFLHEKVSFQEKLIKEKDKRINVLEELMEFYKLK